MQTADDAGPGRADPQEPGLDAPVETVDELVDALRTDPVNVQQSRGNGHTAEIDTALSELVEAADVPVVIALVGDLPDLATDDPAGDLIARLESRLDVEGLYVVAVQERPTTWEYTGDDPEVEDAIYAGLAPVLDVMNGRDEDAPRPSDAGEAALVAATLTTPDGTLAQDQIQAFTRSSTWVRADYYGQADPPTPSAVAALSAVAGVLVALVAWRLARTWALRAITPAPEAGRPRSWSQTAGITPPHVEETPAPTVAAVRQDATRKLDTLARNLAKAPAGTRAEAALGCRVAAEQVLDSADLLDVVGALVLARAGAHLLRRGTPYRPCFVNPLHGAGPMEIEITDSGTTVPVCRRCGADQRQSHRPEALMEPTRGLRRPRPYYEGDTLWARTGFGALDTDLWRQVVDR